MKKDRISINVIRRLPRYLRYLDDLAYKGVSRVSSSEMGKQMGLTASQIRQDFSCFGEFGQQGYGYNVDTLRRHIGTILGMSELRSAVIIGVGNLGRALMGNFDFDKYGFSLVAAFDLAPNVIGTEVFGLVVRDGSNFENFISEHDVDIAIMTVPKRNAHSVAKKLAAAGIKGIWNFTNIDLGISDSDVIVENVHFSDSLLSLSYFLSCQENDTEGKN